MAQPYHRLAYGLTQCAVFVQEEPLNKYRNFSNAVSTELIDLISDILQPRVLNRKEPAQRWCESFELWIQRDRWKPYGKTRDPDTRYLLTTAKVSNALKMIKQNQSLTLQYRSVSNEVAYATKTWVDMKIIKSIADFQVLRHIDHEVSHHVTIAPLLKFLKTFQRS